MLWNKCDLVRLVTCVALISASVTVAQNTRQEVPLVTGGNMPLYPIIARAARVEGIVKLKVTTDGEKVSSIQTESGPAMLVKSARENVLSWTFTKHHPTTFVTMFQYVLEGPDQCTYSNGASILKLPLEVRISAPGIMTCDPSGKTGQL